MKSEQYISVRETAQLLGINEKKVMDLVLEGKLHAYRIANQFVRLKRSEVDSMKTTGEITSEIIQYEYTTSERFTDFFYFNDYYMVSIAIILFLLYLIFFT